MNIMQLKFFQYFELFSLLVSIINYKGLKQFSIMAFIPLLIIINTLEIIGVNHAKPNHSVYNVLIVLETPFFLFLYSKMLMLRNIEKTTFWIISGLTITFVLLNYCFWQGTTTFNTYSLILTQIMNIVLSCLVILRLYMLETHNIYMLKSPYFWINAANLLFGLTVIILLGLQDYIIRHSVKVGKDSLYHYILPSATIVLYSLYAYAFILCRIRTTRL